MRRTPNFIGFVLLVALLLSLHTLVLAAVAENFDGFAPGTTADSITTIPGIASMVSNPANSTVVGDTTVVGVGAPFFALNALFSIGTQLPNTGTSGTLTINFTQPQNSYTMSYMTNDSVGGNFTVEGFRSGVTGPAFTDNYQVQAAMTVATASGSAGKIFTQLVISSTTQDWGIDNLATTDAPAGVTILQSGVSTDVNEAGATTDTYQIALDAPPTTAVTITLTPDAQCTVNPTPIIFNIGSVAPQTVTVKAVDDNVGEAAVHPCVITQTISTTDPAYTGITIPNLTANVTDNDPGYTSTPNPGQPLSTINTTTGVQGTTTLVITEAGSVDLSISNYAMQAGSAGQLAVSGAPKPITLTGGSGQQTTLTVTCTSTIAGTFNGKLVVTHNAAGSPATYDVTCNVTATPGPIYSSTPAPSSTVTLNIPNPAKPVTGKIKVTNTGINTLNLGPITISGGGGHFTLVMPASQQLTANQSADVGVTCDGNLTGTVQGILIITHNGSGAANPATYTIVCKSAGPGFGSTPGAGSIVDVGTILIGQQTTGSVIVSETGNAALNVSMPATGLLTGTNANEFFILTGSPPFTIADGGAAQTITIACIPRAEGLRLAVLTVNTNDPAFPVVSYLLACVGSTVPVITPTPVGFVPTLIPPTATIIIPPTGQVTVVKGLAVRTGPYLGATLINVARPGNSYSILGQNRDEGPFIWYLIQIGRQQGWVSGRYLAVSGTITVAPFVGSIFDQIDNAPDIGVRLTTNAIIDMRRRPSPRTARVGTIPADTEVIVLGRTVQERLTFWIQVSYNGVVGWIPALPVTMRGPVENLPVR
jgi:SH3 domain-containing protein